MSGLLKFITCGSVDDGKSTLIGHILYDSKLLYADQEKALELDSKVGSRGGEIDYSLLLDGLMAEREQGITIDVAYRYFTTDKRSFIVADTPGHEEYTRNMAVGASFADLAVILVDAKQGVLVQTRRHARICSLMGIKYFVFAVNKMDLVGYDENRFKEIEQQIHELSEELSLASVKSIPVSATESDNVTNDSELTIGKDYFVKIGTKQIPGVLKNIQYKIDVNTGEFIPVSSLKKNEIAVCDLSLQEEIVIDEFTKHKTLGELILIDRVTNMTSACGVISNSTVDDRTDLKCAFAYGSLKANGDIFEEYYYNLDSMTITKVRPNGKTYTVGDEIPVEGESYHYPDNFDVVVLRDKVAVKVRNKKIEEIVPLVDFVYGDVPVINGRGFAVLADSNEKVKEFLAQLEAVSYQPGSEFFNKWVKFETYRKIVFRDDVWNE